ncbi:MAG: hypothetical protein JJU36_10200 [Phycisphaeraceae bacterium]|nr:hypothetical protein [Phycisphaeraceae bacterium]
MKTSAEIQDEIRRLLEAASAARETIPVGTPDRRRLQREADRRYYAQLNSEQIQRLRAELAEAQNRER